MLFWAKQTSFYVWWKLPKNRLICLVYVECIYSCGLRGRYFCKRFECHGGALSVWGCVSHFPPLDLTCERKVSGEPQSVWMIRPGPHGFYTIIWAVWISLVCEMIVDSIFLEFCNRTGWCQNGFSRGFVIKSWLLRILIVYVWLFFMTSVYCHSIVKC